jgi:NAD(P)-dependent dehydrogenase (short-subunit alcohol dehydrogenase family)
VEQVSQQNLKDRVIIVTGGTSGIGEACSRHFAECGAKVVMASNQREEGQRLARNLKSDNARFVFTDVADERSVQDLVKQTVESFGRIDGIHCNAGVWRKGRVTAFDDATWDTVMGVNVKGVLWAAKHAIPVMESQRTGGVFLITTSVAAFVGFPEHAVYCASKAALEALVRCLAVDHAGKVRVAAICPGTIDTPMLAASCAGWDKPVAELYAEVARKIPTRRLGQPIDVAKAAAFLMSDDASYINGASLLMDGGTTALPPW